MFRKSKYAGDGSQHYLMFLSTIFFLICIQAEWKAIVDGKVDDFFTPSKALIEAGYPFSRNFPSIVFEAVVFGCYAVFALPYTLKVLTFWCPGYVESRVSNLWGGKEFPLWATVKWLLVVNFAISLCVETVIFFSSGNPELQKRIQESNLYGRSTLALYLANHGIGKVATPDVRGYWDRDKRRPLNLQDIMGTHKEKW